MVFGFWYFKLGTLIDRYVPTHYFQLIEYNLVPTNDLLQYYKRGYITVNQWYMIFFKGTFIIFSLCVSCAILTFVQTSGVEWESKNYQPLVVFSVIEFFLGFFFCLVILVRFKQEHNYWSKMQSLYLVTLFVYEY